MNGYQRISAALKGEKPDKTPIMLHNFLMAAREHGVTMDQYRNSPKVISETFIAAVDKYQYDGILVDIDTVTLAGAAGVQVDFPVNDAARSHEGNIKNLDDVFGLKPVRVGDYKYIKVWLEAVRLLKEYFKDEIYVRGN
jgi:uroporphyrinogen decarboxylase